MSKSRSILFALFAISAVAADLHVDHVTFAGRDLKAMRVKFEALGIHTEYGGEHTNGLTEMALASFADGSYLELIAAQDPKAGAPTHYWGKFIDENAGPCAWAIGVTDIDSVAQRLNAKITASGRRRADGVELKWRSATIGPEPQGTFLPFMIQDVTNRDLRAYPSGNPTMPIWHGVTEIYVAVRDLDAAVKRYRTAFQLPEPIRQGNGARFTGTPVILITGKTGWVADHLAKFGESPIAFGIQGSEGKVHLIK